MEGQSTIISSVDNPQTLREVGIHLGTFSQSLKEIKETEKQHHADNIARNDIILKKLEELQAQYPTRAEFDDFKNDHENRIRTIEQNMWKQIGISGLVSSVGVSIVVIIIQHFIK